jgi:hypothetical protein
MLTLWIVTVIFAGGSHGHPPRAQPGARVTAGHLVRRTDAHGHAVFRVRGGTYRLTVRHCGHFTIHVHGEVTRTRVHCTFP